MDSDSDRSDSDSSFTEEENSSDDDSMSPHSQCRDLLACLETGMLTVLEIDSAATIRIILEEKIDEFCSSLEKCSRITHVTLGDGEGLEWPPLELVDDGHGAGWNRIFESLKTLEQVETLKLKGFSLSAEIMAKIVEALPGAREVEIRLPYFTLTEGNMRPLLEALANHSCQRIILYIDGSIPSSANDSVQNFIADRSVLAELLSLDRLDKLCLDEVNLTVDECMELSSQLSTNTCPASFLKLNACTFADQGGDVVASAFRSNSRLRTLALYDTLKLMENEAFVEELPRNQSIEEISIFQYTGRLSVPWVVRLVTNIAQQNTTVKEITLDGALRNIHGFSTESVQHDFRQALQENYTLQKVAIFFGLFPLPGKEILRLNKAGRRYLVDPAHGASSKTKCIEVLSHPLVKDNLDCLFFHLRENPVLFTGTSSGSVETASNDKKRKADDSNGNGGDMKRAAT